MTVVEKSRGRAFATSAIRANASATVEGSGGAVEPPPAGGHLPTVADSWLLRTTRESALRTPGLTWTDESDAATRGPIRDMVQSRETRKMNLYQSVRDAMRYALLVSVRTTARNLTDDC